MLCPETLATAVTASVLGSLQRQDCTVFLRRLSESHFRPCHFPSGKWVHISQGAKALLLHQCCAACLLSR